MSTTYRRIVDEAYIDRPYPPWLLIRHSSAIYLCFATRCHLLTKDRTETFCSLFCSSLDDQCCATRHLDSVSFAHRRSWAEKGQILLILSSKLLEDRNRRWITFSTVITCV